MFKRILTLAITFVFANVLLYAQSDIKDCIVSKHQLKTVYNEKCLNFKRFEHISYNGNDMMLEYIDRIGSKELTQHCINKWSKLNTDGFENCYKDYLSKNGYISRDDYYKNFYYLEIVSIFNSDLRSYHSANVKKSSNSGYSTSSNSYANLNISNSLEKSFYNSIEGYSPTVSNLVQFLNMSFSEFKIKMNEANYTYLASSNSYVSYNGGFSYIKTDKEFQMYFHSMPNTSIFSLFRANNIYPRYLSGFDVYDFQSNGVVYSIGTQSGGDDLFILIK